MSGTIKQLDGCTSEALPEEVLTSTEPLLLKGLVQDWPIVDAGLRSAQEAAAYIQQFDSGAALVAYEGAPQINGRIFYNDDFTGFNFERTRQTLKQVMQKLFSNKAGEAAPTYYVGSTLIDHWLPGFRGENDIGIGDRECLTSIWFGNRSKIAAHYDFPNNIACSVVGRRRFTLFPPDQADNLYVGPLEFTPSGQPISLVDSVNPDYARFPKYRDAEAASIIVELDPGDALYIPSMWWHHVESLEDFNVLVNYWWRTTPAYQGSPLNALQHAVMSLHDLPVEQRRVWKDIFDRYVFNEDPHAFDHIPEHARGVLSGVDEAAAKAIRAQLVKFLQ
ncbi:MAG: cupin-like domain-containing protein [Arenicella sp.]|nr:cupin-like domain-containing protein [Arenicella sp.]